MAAADPRTGAGPELGTVLDGKYRLVREIAAGAMGRVLEAEHLLLERSVAIKLVASTPDARTRRRMMQEARSAQQLSNEHVVRVFDVGLFGDHPFIVMELLKGCDLATLLAERGPLPVEDAVDYVLQACVGMAEAHATGVIHRDLKPSNLFLSRNAAGKNLIKIVDFGISKVGESSALEHATGERTADGSLLGSPYYMSPEQLRNATRVDARTDVWALGVTLFQLLSGTFPFEGETVNEVSASIFTEPPRDLCALSPQVPQSLRQVIARALAKRPEERIPSVSALAAELAPFASEQGRLSADRLSASPGPAIEAQGVVVRSTDLAETEAALGGTLPALSSDKQPDAPAERAARPTRARFVVPAVVLTGAIAAALAAWWSRTPSQAEVAPATPTATRAATVAPPATAPADVPPPTPAASAPAPPASANVARAAPPPARAGTPRELAPRPRPSAAPPVTSATAKPLDIDGVPIVE